MIRNGKIARLPKRVREELNRRLEDGEQSARLVEWLNGLPEVQALLQADFDGKPISEPNLSAWVQGGYEDWRRQQEALEMTSRFVNNTNDVSELTGERGLVDRAADVAALALGQLLMAVRRMEDGAEKQRVILKSVEAVVRLRKAEREHERSQREAEGCERGAEFDLVCMEPARAKTLRANGGFDGRKTVDGEQRREDRERRTEAGGQPSTGSGQTQRLEGRPRESGAGMPAGAANSASGAREMTVVSERQGVRAGACATPEEPPAARHGRNSSYTATLEGV